MSALIIQVRRQLSLIPRSLASCEIGLTFNVPTRRRGGGTPAGAVLSPWRRTRRPATLTTLHSAGLLVYTVASPWIIQTAGFWSGMNDCSNPGSRESGTLSPDGRCMTKFTCFVSSLKGMT
jgi:hypothetical protein